MTCSATVKFVFPPAVSSGLDLTAGSRLEPLGGGNTVWLDPLNISAVLPGDGFLHVDQTTGYFSADLWMWNITLRGLGQGYLNDVSGGYSRALLIAPLASLCIVQYGWK